MTENAASTRYRLAVTAENSAQITLKMMPYENEKCNCDILQQVAVVDQNYEMWTWRQQYWSIFWITLITWKLALVQQSKTWLIWESSIYNPATRINEFGLQVSANTPHRLTICQQYGGKGSIILLSYSQSRKVNELPQIVVQQLWQQAKTTGHFLSIHYALPLLFRQDVWQELRYFNTLLTTTSVQNNVKINTLEVTQDCRSGIS